MPCLPAGCYATLFPLLSSLVFFTQSAGWRGGQGSAAAQGPGEVGFWEESSGPSKAKPRCEAGWGWRGEVMGDCPKNTLSEGRGPTAVAQELVGEGRWRQPMETWVGRWEASLRP